MKSLYKGYWFLVISLWFLENLHAPEYDWDG
jgi:hypothetical protein